MDETSYCSTRDGLNRRPCVFEKALLAGCAGCRASRRLNLAERETVVCEEAQSHQRCGELLALLRDKSLFALKLADATAPLPHAKAMKIQCGGLRGLADAVGADSAGLDVAETVRRCLERWGDLEALPYSQIVQGVAAWQGRRRSHGTPSSPE